MATAMPVTMVMPTVMPMPVTAALARPECTISRAGVSGVTLVHHDKTAPLAWISTQELDCRDMEEPALHPRNTTAHF